MKKPEFTEEQKDWLCHQVGEWYLEWKSRITKPGVEHRLGFAKEELKIILCDDKEAMTLNISDLKAGGLFYTLDGKKAIPCDDVLTWGKWFQSSNRVIAQTEVNNCQVSTVFLGTNYNYAAGIPTLFETMIFGGEHDEYIKRYDTWDEAEKGHNEIVESIKNGTFKGYDDQS